jgi:hypothetical protein
MTRPAIACFRLAPMVVFRHDRHDRVDDGRERLLHGR